MICGRGSELCSLWETENSDLWERQRVVICGIESEL